MGSCIICGASVDGRICDSHEEDVVFDFRGNAPDELVSNRFYRGTVDGYADFGVFVDLAPGVTGLLHRSELDQRLESLEWEPGDAVFVQVKNVRDNGNVDLGWSIRQSIREFRGTLVQEDGTSRLPDDDDSDGDDAGDSNGDDAGDSDGDDVEDTTDEIDETGEANEDDTDEAHADAGAVGEGNGRSGDVAAAETETDAAENSAMSEIDAAEDPTANEETAGTETSGADETVETEATTGEKPTADGDQTDDEPAPTADYDRVRVETLTDRVSESVRIEGEVVSVRQTGGPTVFEVRDETGVVDVAAFVEAGVRAYPGVELGDIVRIDGEVERRREEIQLETEGLAVLEGADAEAVERRLAEALSDRARPDELDALVADEAVTALSEDVLDAAEAIRRAVLESRPIVVRHPATADGYVAGAAIERAALPLIREEHAKRDAVYHYFTRRPLEGSVYEMDDATTDVTRMLQDRDRHDEKLPLFVLVGTGSTVESADGIGLLDVYDAASVVIDAAVADPETRESVDTLVSPELADVDGDVDLSTGALSASLAATVNGDVHDDLRHLPAVSYWDGTPAAYADLAADAGYDADRVAELREAIALEAYYQSYEDKRELVEDLLFDDAGDLAVHVSEQFREKLETELATARENLHTEDVDGVRFTVLDTDAYTHRYDFPPTALLIETLHRRTHESDEVSVTLGIGTDELYLRSTADSSVREIAAAAAEIAPDADISTASVRDGTIEFLSGERDAVEDAVIAAVADLVSA
ncbi:RecJ-like exonuclease, contains DnaJ-type Zn finger domain [Halopenitus malekzadehii]|uniref:RecJ-like exonuclease, contains DnaJ-type Zn finger domain n=1 Tax=Halopenitus malekzadehii TaxID=1267564 RepID=A0A1H6ICW9_9EURY|nr:OB-fold nucleic acid binding domain-containing protein [Halopenitus malekzadehii]SEH46650.1 RecJ-like exonuclease, contains DnaJ-type Zn finger domain [Halopenitus malekzadehii]